MYSVKCTSRNTKNGYCMLIQDGLDCLCGRFVPVTFVIPEYVLVEMPIVKDLFSAPSICCGLRKIKFERDCIILSIAVSGNTIESIHHNRLIIRLPVLHYVPQ